MKNANVRYIEENEFEKWDAFVDTSPQGNIFNKSFWLKAVSNEFKILVCEENGQIVGGIALTSTYGGFYRNPKLTPQLGVLFIGQGKNEKYSKRISKEIEISNALIEKLPKFKQFNYNFSYNFTNLLPFIWNGFKSSVTYSYVIEDLSDLDKVYSNFEYDVKYSVNRATKNNIKVTSDFGIKEFYELNKKTYARQKMEIPYTFEFLSKLDAEIEKCGKRRMFFGLDSENNIISAAYILYDDNVAYYLMGGTDPEYRNTGVQTLLLWESIKFASTVSKMFDFEGSTVMSIEKYFRGFGGKQRIIYNIYKSSPMTEFLFNIARKNKNIIRKIIKV
jgi:Uncharacterized protein involved in methicillin resistance